MIRTYTDKSLKPTTVMGPFRELHGELKRGTMTFPIGVPWEEVVAKCAARWGEGVAHLEGDKWHWRPDSDEP